MTDPYCVTMLTTASKTLWTLFRDGRVELKKNIPLFA